MADSKGRSKEVEGNGVCQTSNTMSALHILRRKVFKDEQIVLKGHSCQPRVTPPDPNWETSNTNKNNNYNHWNPLHKYISLS